MEAKLLISMGNQGFLAPQVTDSGSYFNHDSVPYAA